jgi:phenylalanyl-tRNA synthetase alpha chain
MSYSITKINDTAEVLKKRFIELQDKSQILRDNDLRALFADIVNIEADQRALYGQEANALRNELTAMVEAEKDDPANIIAIDITAPFDVNSPKRPHLLDSSNGSIHPIMGELDLIMGIFNRMGFMSVESRLIDDDYHMFSSLNFPEGHPARDDYDTFMTTQKDKNGKSFIAPAHTSTMQNRVLKTHKVSLEKGHPIAAVIPGRVFRNEDLDARHEHTFYMVEGVYVDKGVNTGMLIATLKTFLEEYFQKEIEVKVQPFYFPFTEPSFEFVSSCVFCDKKGCSILGCGMIHPNVLKEAGIDPKVYSGFAWGMGIERPIMLKYVIEDIRYFESGRLDFLRQFS